MNEQIKIEDNKNKESNIPGNELTTIIEGKEDTIIDENLGSILKWIGIVIGSIFLIIFGFYYSFFDVKNNFVGITEGFFTKNISVYTNSGIKMINPFNFNMKTTYPLALQSISFSDDNNEIPDKIKSNNGDNIDNSNNIQTSIYDSIYKSKGLKVNTQDEIAIAVKMSISYKLSNNAESIKNVYNNTGNGNFIEKIVLPTITSTVSDVYSKYKLIDIVNKGKQDKKSDISLGNVLKERLKQELSNKGFELVNFTFGGIEASSGITKTIEELFNTQNQKELETAKQEILELTNKNALKELELTNNIYKEIKKNKIEIQDYQKIKMLQIFENKWDGKLIPENLNKLLQ